MYWITGILGVLLIIGAVLLAAVTLDALARRRREAAGR